MRSVCVALACLFANAACGDGIGTPIQLAVASEGVAGADGGDGSSPDVVAARCATVDDGVWDDRKFAEDELTRMINEQRDVELQCGGDTYHPDPPLNRAPQLRCSARLHSVDMAIHGVMDMSSDGLGPGQRMTAAGFDHSRSEESIVAGESDPRHVFDRLLDDSEDCAHVSTGELTHIGVGYYEGFWTIDYAAEDEDNDNR